MAWLGVITNNGNDLLTRWVEGKNLHITRAAAGQGRVEQTAMLAQISASSSALLPVIADFFKTPRLYFLLDRNGGLEAAACDVRAGTCAQDRLPLAAGGGSAFAAPSRAELPAAELAED